MMYLSNEIGAVPVLGAANAAFEHRIAREAATGQPSRGSLARPPATPAAPPTAAPAPGKRLKTPGKGILVRCAGEGTSLSMQATVHEARKSGSWVVVLNA